MRVYGITLHMARADRERLRAPDHARQIRAIIATTSQRKAAEAFDVSLYFMQGWGSETGNEREIITAMSAPGTVFVRALDDHSGEYVPR